MRHLAIVLFLSLFTFSASADPAAYVGITYSFKGDFGIGLKVLSNDEEEEAVAGLGITYHPTSDQKWGVDVSAGYTFENGATLVGWDFLKNSVQLSAGYADVEEDEDDRPITNVGFN